MENGKEARDMRCTNGVFSGPLVFLPLGVRRYSQKGFVLAAEPLLVAAGENRCWHNVLVAEPLLYTMGHLAGLAGGQPSNFWTCVDGSIQLPQHAVRSVLVLIVRGEG